MYDELTPTDIKKMEDEIEYRKLVVLNIMERKNTRIRTRAGSVIWRE